MSHPVFAHLPLRVPFLPSCWFGNWLKFKECGLQPLDWNNSNRIGKLSKDRFGWIRFIYECQLTNWNDTNPTWTSHWDPYHVRPDSSWPTARWPTSSKVVLPSYRHVHCSGRSPSPPHPPSSFCIDWWQVVEFQSWNYWYPSNSTWSINQLSYNVSPSLAWKQPLDSLSTGSPKPRPHKKKILLLGLTPKLIGSSIIIILLELFLQNSEDAKGWESCMVSPPSSEFLTFHLIPRAHLLSTWQHFLSSSRLGFLPSALPPGNPSQASASPQPVTVFFFVFPPFLISLVGRWQDTED